MDILQLALHLLSLGDQRLQSHTPQAQPLPSPYKNYNLQHSIQTLPNTSSSLYHYDYKVPTGATIGGLSKKYGLTVNDLQQWNPNKDLNKLQGGDVIKIPKNWGSA